MEERMRFYRGDDQTGKRIEISWQNSVLCEFRVKEKLWLAFQPKKQEKSHIKWKLIMLHDVKLPLDFPLKSSIKSTILFFFPEECPMYWRA